MIKKNSTQLSQLLLPLFDKLKVLNIPYCICGNYFNIPYHTDNDVDIWANEPIKLIRIIEDICLDLKFKIYLKNTNATGSNLFIHTNDSEQLTLIHIDILRDCSWYAILPLVRSEVIKYHRKQYNNFFVANETIDAAMHLMYPLSHFGHITKKYHNDIQKASTDNNFWEIVENGWGTSFCNKIKLFITNADWLKLENEFAKNKSRLLLNSIRNMRKTEFHSFFSFVFHNFYRLLRPAGLFIAFVGPDGCGKTTVQNNLEPFFKKGFTKGKINKFYWRPFLFPRIKALLSRGENIQADDDEPAARLELRKVSPTKKLIHCIKLIYYWLDYIFGRLKYQGTWSRGGIVCFDRYWDDLLVFPERFGLSVPKWLVQTLGVFVPKPDIIFYLHAEAEVLIDRKLELPLNEMRVQVDHYKKLSLINNNYVLVDGNLSRDDVLTAVIQICLKKMSKRYIKSNE